MWHELLSEFDVIGWPWFVIGVVVGRVLTFITLLIFVL